MNVIKIHNKAYKYESLWRPSKKDKVYDYDNNLLPYPTEGKEWQNRIAFINKLNSIQKHIIRTDDYTQYDRHEYKDCLLCGKKNITKGVFELGQIRWEDGLKHYIDVHKIKPSVEFIDFIFGYIHKPSYSKKKIKVGKLTARVTINNNMKYLKIDRNQLLILDALMEFGSYKKYIDKSKKSIYRYSEHAGLLDFNDTGLERIIVKADTTRINPNDNDIFLPEDFKPDELDYEYIFHTHPPTDGIGGRAKYGILYEFPSLGDLIYFVELHNETLVQGSIVIAPEGMYIIRNLKMDTSKIIINIDKFFGKCRNIQYSIEAEAIKKYGIEFSKEEFYTKIAQDMTYINKFNEFLNKHNIHIDYYPRIKDGHGTWVIDSVYLPIYIVEPDYNIA